ncbi:hypothetical protein ACT453_16330, partial [Bacillus sp. D-CC]
PLNTLFRPKVHNLLYPHYLTVIPGEVIDYDFVTNWFVRMSERYHIQEVCYDPFNAAQWFTQMQNLGFEMVKVQQG